MNKIKITKIAFTVALALAASLTLSCSGDDSGGNPIKKDKITGVSQKGPFVKGSAATLYELDGSFAQTGRSFRDIIADDYGTFEIKNVELASPYAMLEADGFYRNEVTGKTSSAPIKLYAIADIREKDNVNVNLLTHLEYYRVLNLAENGKTVAEAKKQAQKEILAVFGINGDFENSEDMSIFGTTEGDAALLAISVLLQGYLSEGNFSQRLTDFAFSLKESGTWDDENRAKLVNGFDYIDINNSILSWGLSSEIPDYEKYVDDYIISFSGECNEEKNRLFKKYSDNSIITCNSGKWWKQYNIPFPANDCGEANEGQCVNVPCTEEDAITGKFVGTISCGDSGNLKGCVAQFKCKNGDWWNGDWLNDTSCRRL
jgi:hypothetical protein